MFRMAFQHPQFYRWQARLSRVPRWGWVVIGIAVILPVAVLLASLALLALGAGALALGVVVTVLAVRAAWLRIASRFRRPRADAPLTHVVVRRVYEGE
jgi:hypothetical protein